MTNASPRNAMKTRWLGTGILFTVSALIILVAFYLSIARFASERQCRRSKAAECRGRPDCGLAVEGACASSGPTLDWILFGVGTLGMVFGVARVGVHLVRAVKKG